jgi:hypothetical protein
MPETRVCLRLHARQQIDATAAEDSILTSCCRMHHPPGYPVILAEKTWVHEDWIDLCFSACFHFLPFFLLNLLDSSKCYEMLSLFEFVFFF